MELDPLLLSRIQFAVTIGFHFLFPPITIGLAWLVVLLEWQGWKKDDLVSLNAGKFFGKILGLTFAVGVATGIVMEFQFGTNWAEYSKFVGDIFGAPLAAEALFAFFLESCFLGLYLFGRERVSKGIHWFSALMVAVGSTISAFWIIVANSWQQTPAGFVLNNGRAELTSFYEAVFNPSTIVRYTHTMLACLLVGAFFMAGISAYHILKEKALPSAQKTLKMSLIMSLVSALLLLFPTGHHHAVQVAELQPAKLAAMEGLIKGQTNAPFTVFGIPQEDPPALHFAIRIPSLLSFFISGDVNTHVAGIEDLRAAGKPTPPLALTFISFHIMAILGTLFILISALGVFLLYRKKLFSNKLFLKILLYTSPLPLIVCQFGWIVAEVGRQPWVVYEVLKTADAFSTNVSGAEVLASLIMFSIVYLFLAAFYIFVLFKKVKHGPEVA